MKTRKGTEKAGASVWKPQADYEKVHKTYSESIGTFETYIPISVKAAETSAEGISIFEHCGNGKVAMAYESLTKEFLENNGEAI